MIPVPSRAILFVSDGCVMALIYPSEQSRSPLWRRGAVGYLFLHV